MILWPIAAGALCATIWLYLALFRARFWIPPREPAPADASQVRIAAVIPARDEAATIGEAVRSIFRQQGVGSVFVFVVDDHSNDRTAEVARSAAEAEGALKHFTAIRGAALPPGWSGKLWAMQQGIEAALKCQPDYLLLTDADIRHAPNAAASLLTPLQAPGSSLASYMVRLYCRSAAEKLLIPAFVYFFFLLYPPRWIADPQKFTAGAAGGCVLLRPDALESAGGVAAIRGEIIDDCALAAAVKRGGGRLWLGLASGSESLRPYGAWREIGRMISRTAFSQLRHSAILLLACLLGLAATFLLPLATLATGSPVAIALPAAALLLMVMTYFPLVRFYRLNPLWTLTLPLAAIFYAGATIHSAVSYRRGRGGQWKGRVQDKAAAR